MSDIRLKRLTIPWSKKKKTFKFITAPRGPHKLEKSVPLIVVLRDMLCIADIAKEAKGIIKSGGVFVDGKICKDHKHGVGLFDVIEFPSTKESYRIVIKKIPEIIKIPSNEKCKICKIISKKVLKKGKTQINLHDGRNIILEKNSYSVNDSLLIELPNQKILEHIKFEPGSKVLTLNTGNILAIKKIERGLNKKLWIESGKGMMEVSFKDIIVVGKEKPLITLSKA